MKSNRLIPLEGCRGIAAIIVVLHHFFLGFLPKLTGAVPSMRDDQSFIGNWYFVFFNGYAAVNFFFVLSGFVLCWSFFKNEDVKKLKLAAIKRFPRLTGPILVTTVVSYCLFIWGGYFFSEAGALSKSSWLSTFAYTEWTPAFHPSIYQAIIQGVTVCLTGESGYNSSLWTMRPEFFGSILVYFIAAFRTLKLRAGYLFIAFLFLVAIALKIYIFFIPFLIGLFLAIVLTNHPMKIPTSISFLIILMGLYFLGYAIPEKNYLWVSRIRQPEIIKDNIQLILNSVGAFLILFAIVSCNKVYKFLDNRIGMFLGKISFPLYLIYVLIICSLGSWVYIQLLSAGLGSEYVVSITWITTLSFSIMVATAFSYFDEFWIRLLNKIFQTLNLKLG
jgi:peptidoglycan/LPS O-acetylase OafA/YrhL